eukprot:25041-Pyramimonas_sp.AAC.1
MSFAAFVAVNGDWEKHCKLWFGLFAVVGHLIHIPSTGACGSLSDFNIGSIASMLLFVRA